MIALLVLILPIFLACLDAYHLRRKGVVISPVAVGVVWLFGIIGIGIGVNLLASMLGIFLLGAGFALAIIAFVAIMVLPLGIYLVVRSSKIKKFEKSLVRNSDPQASS